MTVSVKQLIDRADYQGLKSALSANPQLANEGLPYDELNTTKAHPLHRICDGVYNCKYSDEEGVEMARLFLEYGADVNGGEMIEKKDSPLVAAASLHADKVAILYIEQGADIHHGGCHGGTALHWAAWCGRATVVERLIQAQAEINRRCIDFQSTPLFWAVHGLYSSDKKDMDSYLQCVKLLLEAGADKSIPNSGGKTVFDMIEEEDKALKELLS
ncbi:ankyrin repeat domain-containing protein [Emticicia fluvialis]|uniref:ankyrin repeat domain-containing protein n=1 Tax=Emticicia fluvialis TaxID=2974474 RepID=UPI0021657081|nr:ankyrin repeat domain-containing protein [Emticicia fluvialis]